MSNNKKQYTRSDDGPIYISLADYNATYGDELTRENCSDELWERLSGDLSNDDPFTILPDAQ